MLEISPVTIQLTHASALMTYTYTTIIQISQIFHAPAQARHLLNCLATNGFVEYDVRFCANCDDGSEGPSCDRNLTDRMVCHDPANELRRQDYAAGEIWRNAQ